MLDSWLAYLYAPILPFLKKIKIRRLGHRSYNPRDILVPEGYAVELVASGFNAPVHCCFDDEGLCYISEAGHKIDSRPRIVRVDVENGEKMVFFDLPPERWNKTGALWRIRRTGGARGYGPPKPLVLPLYLFEMIGALLGIIGLAGIAGYLVKKWLVRGEA